MSVINDLINIESDSLDFGNYELATKTKKDGIEYKGDIYKIKTFNEITKLEKNGMFVYESVPGTAVHGFRSSEEDVSFIVEGDEDAQITLGLCEDTEYEVFEDGKSRGKMKTNLGGKLNISVELENAEEVHIKVIH